MKNVICSTTSITKGFAVLNRFERPDPVLSLYPMPLVLMSIKISPVPLVPYHHNDDPLAAMVGITMHDTPPDDEVLLRLLPNAYADQVDASEFRRYTESTLRQKKQAHAMAMRMHLKSALDGIVEVDHDGANAWLGAMNDVRLALGVRLKVQENTHEDLELLAPDDPMRGVYAVYSWLGWLQESLISALMDDSE